MGATRSDDELRRYRRLDRAFRSGDLATLERELGDRDGFPNCVAHPAMGGCLTFAIYHAPLELVRALLDAGADPDWPDDDGFPPLIAALTCSVAAPGAPARRDVPELVDLLLSAGADVGRRGINDYTPLHLAASQGDRWAVERLLAAGADADAITRIDDLETPFELAVAGGHDDVAHLLEPLTTRLRWDGAVAAGDVQAVAQLVGAGHDIDACDGFGQTALMRAAHAGHLDLVDWLAAHGADLDHTSKYGLSALMLAVVGGHPRAARRLVAAGADTTLRGTGAPGFDGKDAADLADARGDARLARFLRSADPTG